MDEEFKPDYGRRALFTAEDNKQRVMTLEKKVAVMERQLSQKIEETQSAVQGIATIDTRIEIVHGEVVRAAQSTILTNVIPYLNDKVSYTDYILLSGSGDKLLPEAKTAPRLQVVPAELVEEGFQYGGAEFISKTVEIPAYSVLDGKQINSLGFCSGSGNLLFSQAVIQGGITKEAGKAMRLIATLCFVYG